MFGFKTKAERTAFRKGLLSGLRRSKMRKKKTFKSSSSFPKKQRVEKPRVVKSSRTKKMTRDRFISLANNARRSGDGVMMFRGKLYDVNFKDKPLLINDNELRSIRESYPGDSDFERANNYALHMRRKFGVFDQNGRFLHMLSEEDKK